MVHKIRYTKYGTQNMVPKYFFKICDIQYNSIYKMMGKRKMSLGANVLARRGQKKDSSFDAQSHKIISYTTRLLKLFGRCYS